MAFLNGLGKGYSNNVFTSGFIFVTCLFHNLHIQTTHCFLIGDYSSRVISPI